MFPLLALTAGLALADDPAPPAPAPAADAPAAPSPVLPVLPSPFPASACGALSDQALGALPTFLLADRIRMELPEGAYTKSMPQGLMSAPIPDEATSLVFMEAGPDRMGLVASETWQVTGPDFEAAARRLLSDLPDAGAPWTIQRLPMVDSSVSAVAWWPSKLIITGDSDVHALDVLFADKAGAVVHVAWLLDGTTANLYGLGCTGLAARLAASATLGTRALPLGTDNANLPVNERHAVHLDIPDHTALFSQPGPDFAVYYILPLVPIDQATSSLGVYIGASPQAIPPGNRPDLKGKLLGDNGSWTVADEGGDGGVPALYRMERVVPLKDKKASGPPMYVHVFIAAATLDDRERLLKVAETMRWAKPTPKGH